VTDGAHPGRGQVDGIESASPKFADDGGTNSGKAPHDPPGLTALSNDVNGDDSGRPFKTNLDQHASVDTDINDQHPADNSLHTLAQHDDGPHPTDPPVDVNELPSFKFADNGSGHPDAGPDGGHTPDPQVDRNQLKFADDGSGHPGTGPDGASAAHGQADGNQSDSFKFADNNSAHPGTIPNDPPALTAPSNDLSGNHEPAAPALAKPFDVPGTVMSDAASEQVGRSDKFMFAENAGHGPSADHKTDMTEIDHPMPADIQQVLDTAHETNAVSPPDPSPAHALPETANAQAPYHADAFHFA
jgi:hypothetical protein